MKARWIWAPALALICGAVFAGAVLATSQSGVTTTILANKVPFGPSQLPVVDA